ncbi:MAG: DUF362 domain-containing protein [Acidobacteriota bacterium]|nr:DUF362 domain-containing protein [Acidobacteriota bacterium]
MISRRAFVSTAAAGLAGCSRPAIFGGPRLKSRVAILRATSYSDDLVDRLLRGAALCGLDVKDKRVLLKPNLVEFDRGAPINTNVALIAAAVETFERLGASEVSIGEGPGHRRDTTALTEQAGYRSGVADFDRRFTDLNRDDVSPIRNFAGLPEIFLPNTALRADLIVSLAKMKTHHWAGATLSMKNFFGLVPGAVYGWPKNKLHFIGIDRSVAELHRIFPRSFGIVDGVVGMDGNGPIQGSPRHSNVIVMGGDTVAIDATCCRLMSIDPEQIEYLRLASARGHIEERKIEQLGESIASARLEYRLLPEMAHLRLKLAVG